MKRNIPAFLSGALTTALVGTIAVSALAASGRMTIEVDPINVQVNGEVFQPTDANGNAVPVFVYQGTTYAPLRALAEAYGLEVGYDKATNMATVADTNAKPVDTPSPDTVAKSGYSFDYSYEEFLNLWDIEIIMDPGKEKITFISKDKDATLFWWDNASDKDKESYLIQASNDEILSKFDVTWPSIRRYFKTKDNTIFASVWPGDSNSVDIKRK